jgi:hypothetical protein
MVISTSEIHLVNSSSFECGVTCNHAWCTYDGHFNSVVRRAGTSDLVGLL